MKHDFPAEKWTKLATGLKLARATTTIKANEYDVDSRLQALIIHWLTNDQEATWQKLVNAMIISKEKVAVAELAKDVGASYTGTVLITMITTTYTKLRHALSVVPVSLR